MSRKTFGSASSEEAMAAQRADLEGRLSRMSAQERTQMGARMERQLQQASEGWLIAIYRVMEKVEIPGILVQPSNQAHPRRYIR